MRFESIAEAHAWLNGHINHERGLGRVRYKEDFALEPFRRFMARLGDPQRCARAVHVAGSCGKGSTTLLLEALLRARGLRVASYVSPHYREYRERIRVDGAPVSEAEFMRALEIAREASGGGATWGAGGEAKPAADPEAHALQTVFELLTAAFFVAARGAEVDWMVVETGLGGRLDATNALDPGPVVWTRIGMEHAHLLGDTISKIAAEKAAILKAGGWAVAARQEPSGPGGGAREVFEERARGAGAPLIWAETATPLLEAAFHPEGMTATYAPACGGLGFVGPLRIDAPLFGPFLTENIQSALTAIQRLEDEGAIPRLSPEATIEAIRGAELTGRMSRIRRDPDVFVDGGHCPAAAAAVAQTMAAHFGPNSPAVAIVGMVEDKDHVGFFRELSSWSGWRAVLCYTLASQRAEPGDRLARRAEGFFPAVRGFADVHSALNFAAGLTEKSYRFVATGSTYGVAAAMDGGFAAWAPK